MVTREKYIGKTIPDNLDEIKSEFLNRCNREELFIKLAQIKKGFSTEWKNLPKSIKEKFLQQLSIDFTYNTNAIEGSKLTLRDTAELLQHNISPNKPLQDVEEAVSHRDSFFIMLSSQKKFHLRQILQLHSIIFNNTKADIAGKLRDYLVKVGSYVAPDWQDVEQLMAQLIKWYVKNKAAMQSVELAARFHYKFEKIHPCGDGNGRIGRLLMNHILWHSGFPLLIIEYKRKNSYYRVLASSEDRFFQYFVRRYLAVHKKYLSFK